MKPSPRGFALLIVLWSVVLLAVLATSMTAAGRSDLQLAGNIRRAAAAEAAADGGIAAAVFHASGLPATIWPADGQPRPLRIGAYAVTVRIMDENGKLNPNYAQAGLLAALLSAAGADTSRAATLAQAINAWHAPGVRDPIIQAYRAAGMVAAPSGSPFSSVAELGLVIGMTPDLLARLSPHLSVFATGPLQIARADPVLAAAMRSLAGGVAFPPPSPASVLNITADAQGLDGTRFVRHAIVALDGGTAKQPFRILLWEALPAG